MECNEGAAHIIRGWSFLSTPIITMISMKKLVNAIAKIEDSSTPVSYLYSQTLKRI